MSPRTTMAALLTGAVVATALVISIGGEKPLEVGETPVDLEVLGRYPDGGKGYVVHVRVADGGIEARRTTPKCVRRPKGAPVIACMRQVPGDIARDFGELNRMPAAWAVGAGCEPVACAVSDVADSDKNEDAVLLEVGVDLPEVLP